MVLLILTSLAAELTPVDLALAPAVYPAAKGKKGKKGKKKGPHWEKDFYVRPQGGARVYKNSSGTSTSLVTVGGEAGYAYDFVGGQPPWWGGHTRAAIDYVAANDSSGYDLRVGSFFGPTGKLLDASAGLDAFYNTWKYGNQTLPESWGVELPVTLGLHQERFWIQVGGAVAYLDNPARRVDWSKEDVPGIGHEMAAFASAGGRMEGVDVGAQYEWRMTAIGPVQEVGAFVTVSGAGIQDLWDLIGDSDSDSGGGGKKSSGGTKK